MGFAHVGSNPADVVINSLLKGLLLYNIIYNINAFIY
tara:strand:+ start:619 stop:729 length:111 start_codon:yes stop_codon:yes gene_type:complete